MLFLLASLALAADPAPDWQKQESAHLTNVRQLTFDFARAGEGYFSPDGRQIIFQVSLWVLSWRRQFDLVVPLTANRQMRADRLCGQDLRPTTPMSSAVLVHSAPEMLRVGNHALLAAVLLYQAQVVCPKED